MTDAMDDLTLLRRQYYALCPAYLLSVPSPSTLASEEGHDALLSLLNDDPPPPEREYARQFWRRVLPVLEKGIMLGEGVEEVDERIYETVTSLAVGAGDAGAPKQSFKTFLYDLSPRLSDATKTLSSSDHGLPGSSSDRHEGRITLLEEQVAVSSGSTGLRTWTASLHLGHHLLQNSVTLSPRVVELGAGTGFLSTLLTQLGHDVLATDLGDIDSPECPRDEPGTRQTPLSRLRRNFALNGIPEEKAQALDWADARSTPRPEVWDQAKGRDIVAADVIYDPDIVPLLVDALSTLLQEGRQAILAATVRNEETFRLFLSRCGDAGLKTEILQLEPMSRERPTFWDTALDLGARVEVVRITRN